MPPTDEGPDASLKRLGGGRWQTRDERFTIEPQSGTWVVVDAEQTDDLGLPLVRGPFRSLTDAKMAIAEARTSPAAASPLADRVGRRRATGADAEPAGSRGARRGTAGQAAGRRRAAPDELTDASSPRSDLARPTATGTKALAEPPYDEEPAEPRWFAALEPDVRRRAARLIVRLEQAGAPDPEGMARRDVAGDVAAVAAFAIERRLQELPDDADAAAVAGLLAEGRDDALGVRWRLVDDADRPITLRPAPRRGGGNRRH